LIGSNFAQSTRRGLRLCWRAT